MKNEKFKTIITFWGFQSPEVRKQKKKYRERLPDSYICFQSILSSQKYRRMVKYLCCSYLVCSQIWLNLHMDDHHFSYIFFHLIGLYVKIPKLFFLVTTLAMSQIFFKNSIKPFLQYKLISTVFQYYRKLSSSFPI